MRYPTAIIAIACCALLGGCLDSTTDSGHEWEVRPPRDHGDGPSPELCNNFASTLTVLDRMEQPVDSFIQGEPIIYEMRVENISGTPQTLTTGGCPQITFVVVNRLNQVVWTSLDGFACTLQIRDITYEPGQVEVFRAEWNQVMRNDRQAPIGEYTVHGEDGTQCSAELDEEADFTIR